MELLEGRRTINWPVTLTIRLAPLSLEGCASRVVTLCATFVKGKDLVEEKCQFLLCRLGRQIRPTYNEFLDDTIDTLDRAALPCKHGLGAVEVFETSAVGVERVIVEVGELRGDGADVGHGGTKRERW